MQQREEERECKRWRGGFRKWQERVQVRNNAEQDGEAKDKKSLKGGQQQDRWRRRLIVAGGGWVGGARRGRQMTNCD